MWKLINFPSPIINESLYAPFLPKDVTSLHAAATTATTSRSEPAHEPETGRTCDWSHKGTACKVRHPDALYATRMYERKLNVMYADMYHFFSTCVLIMSMQNISIKKKTHFKEYHHATDHDYDIKTTTGSVQ